MQPFVHREQTRLDSHQSYRPLTIVLKRRKDRRKRQSLLRTKVPPAMAELNGMETVNISNVTELDAFRALGNAAGAEATVIVDPQHRSVEVAHHVQDVMTSLRFEWCDDESIVASCPAPRLTIYRR